MAKDKTAYVQAIAWSEIAGVVHAAGDPGTCYRTACGLLLETWSVQRRQVMSVNCEGCLSTLREAVSAAEAHAVLDRWESAMNNPDGPPLEIHHADIAALRASLRQPKAAPSVR